MFKISDFLCKKAVTVEIASKDKKGAINELIELLVKARKSKDGIKALKAVMEREAIGTTGVGQGVAIPHGRTDTVSSLTGAFGISKQGIQFDSLDGEPVHLIFLLLSPVDSGGQHLRALARISRLFKDKYFRESLIDAKSEEDLLKIIGQEDKY